MSDALSQLTNIGNQNAAHEFNYLTETMSNFHDTKKIHKSIFPINFKISYQCQDKYPGLTAKLKALNINAALFVEEEIKNQPYNM